MKPSDLLLLSAASCSTHDVAMILNKQRQPLQGLEVVCTGEQMPEPPFSFTNIHLHYIVKGQCNPEKVARAIQLSEEKYCSILNTLRGTVALTSDFELI
jgi:putative redox protein